MRQLLPAICVLTIACGSAESGGSTRVGVGGALLPDTQTVAGVLEMRHGADALERAPVWTLDSVPMLVIDGGEEFDLGWVSPPILLADGRSVVLRSLGGGEMMLFDTAGRPSRLLAGSGSGPGELIAPAGVNLIPGDTIVVADRANTAINWYTADSGLVRTERLEVTWPFSCFQSAGQLEDSRQVAIGYCSSNVMNEDRTLRGTTPLVLYSLDRTRLDTVRMIPGIEMQLVDVTQGSRTYAMPRAVELGRHPTVTAVNSTIVLAGGVGGYVIELISPAGETTGRIAVDRPVQQVTDAIKQAAIQKQLDLIDETPYEAGANIDAIKDDARNAPYATTLPPYGRVLPGGEDVIWVLDYALPSDAAWVATAFRLDGTILGRLSGPRSGEGLLGGPVRFGADRVIVREVDGDGVVRFGVWSYSERPSDASIGSRQSQ